MKELSKDRGWGEGGYGLTPPSLCCCSVCRGGGEGVSVRGTAAGAGGRDNERMVQQFVSWKPTLLVHINTPEIQQKQEYSE